jgi:1-acyl-sn-glycerol-3-phosphate acyltransferase
MSRLDTTLARRRGMLVPPAPQDVTASGRLLGRLLAFGRVAAILLFTPGCCVVQAVLLRSPGRGKVRFAAFYWAAVARLLGLRVRVLGTPAAPSARPLIYVCNHASWLDIPALGGTVQGCFVSKDDVAGWPIVGTIARLGRTVFVSRSRQSIGRERDEMGGRLAGGDALVLFPEGTSSDGSRVLPFRSSFFAAAFGPAAPLIQPVSVVYDRLAGLPVGRISRTVFAWYGDMSLTPHLWELAQWRGKRASLLFHPLLDPRDFPTRKALSQATWEAVAGGAAALRQNRSAKRGGDA